MGFRPQSIRALHACLLEVIRSPSGGRPRGQTALDFTIGVSVFLVVMVFVFSFVPGVLGPFVSTGGDHPALTDRLADRLAQGGLGDPEEPFVLDRDCTVEFFNGSRYDDGLGSPGECRYDGNAFEERLAIDDGPNTNVTLSGNASAGIDGATTLCWDESGGDLVQVESAACDSDDVRLTAGGIPPRDNDATVTARRVVSLTGEDATLEVVVW